MAFNIGDQVRVKRFDEIPATRKANMVGGDPHLWNQGKSRSGGKTGKVIDKLYSEAYGCNIYRVILDGYDRPTRNVFTDECIEMIQENPTDFSYDIRRIDDKIRAILYRKQADGSLDEIGVGYGYILHENMEGIAQAASYAMRMLFKNTNWHEDKADASDLEEGDMFEKAQKYHEEVLKK